MSDVGKDIPKKVDQSQIDPTSVNKKGANETNKESQAAHLNVLTDLFEQVEGQKNVIGRKEASGDTTTNLKENFEKTADAKLAAIKKLMKTDPDKALTELSKFLSDYTTGPLKKDPSHLSKHMEDILDSLMDMLPDSKDLSPELAKKVSGIKTAVSGVKDAIKNPKNENSGDTLKAALEIMASNISKLIQEVYKAQSASGDLKSKALGVQMKAKTDAVMKVLADSVTSAEASAKQADTQKTMQTVMKVIGAVIMVAGVIAAVASGQPEVAAVAIAVGIFFISGGADALIGAMGDAIGGAITTDLEAGGMSKADAEKVGKAIGHIIAAIIVAIVITAITLGVGGIAAGAEDGAEIAGQGAEETEEIVASSSGEGVELTEMGANTASNISSAAEEEAQVGEGAVEESSNIAQKAMKGLLKALKNRTWRSGGVKSMVGKGSSTFLQSFVQGGGVSSAVTAATTEWISNAPNDKEKHDRESAAVAITIIATLIASAAAMGAGGAGAAADTAADARSASGLMGGKTGVGLNVGLSALGLASGAVNVTGEGYLLSLAMKTSESQKTLGESKALQTVFKMLTDKMSKSGNNDYKQTMELVKKDGKMLAAIQNALVTESQAANAALTR